MADSGDAATLATRLFEQHGSAVRRYLRRLTGEAELARDLAQDVFLRVVRSGGHYQARERERAWIFRIVRNVFLDHRRDRARRPQLEVVRADAMGAAAQPTQVGLDAALRSLEEIDRDAFLLCELGGLRYDEIAVALDLTVAGVRSRIYRARLTLRAALTPPERTASTIHTRPDDVD